MARRRAAHGTAGLAVVVALLAGCGGDDEAAPTTTSRPAATTTAATAPPRPTSTTTTVYDPATVEGQVEAAYLRSWDVYADAVYHLVLDDDALQSAYVGEALDARRSEIADRIRDGRAAIFGMDHQYQIVLHSPSLAVIVDVQVGHQRLIDPATKVPIEPDPNLKRVRFMEVRHGPAGWRVATYRDMR